MVYWPWVSQFDEAFTSSLATGESLSGSIPALIGVAQVSADGKATLSVEAFFYSMAAIQVSSLRQTAQFAIGLIVRCEQESSRLPASQKSMHCDVFIHHLATASILP